MAGWMPLAGAPLYKSASRMSGIPRYFEDEELTHRCTDFVKENGGLSFFQHWNWRGRLSAAAKAYKRKKGINERLEELKETIEAVRSHLRQSKEIIEEHIPGHQVSILAYPWGIGSHLAVEQSKKLGFKGNFWVIGPYKEANCGGGNPYFINRIKDDYIFRLPGKGRKSLWEVFKLKLLRRIRGEEIY